MDTTTARVGVIIPSLKESIFAANKHEDILLWARSVCLIRRLVCIYMYSYLTSVEG